MYDTVGIMFINVGVLFILFISFYFEQARDQILALRKLKAAP